MARMVEGLLLQQHQHQHQQQQEPNRQRTASRSLIGISNGNRSNEVRGVHKLSRGEICAANFKVPLRMVRVWTGF